MSTCKSFLQFTSGALILTFLFACSGVMAPKAVSPQPDAVVSAAIDTSGKAESGLLSFKVSHSGGQVVDLHISLVKANCQNMISMGKVEDFFSNPGIQILDGAFSGALPAMGGLVTDYRFTPGDVLPTPVDDPMTVGKISGRFTSPTSASGTILIYLGAAMSGGRVCELGTFNWSSN